jgi:hypothetical protein
MVGDAGDGVSYDHADWAEARFLVSGARPKTVSAPREEPVILTPRAGPAPRINGPCPSRDLVFATRPRWAGTANPPGGRASGRFSPQSVFWPNPNKLDLYLIARANLLELALGRNDP